jgi:Zn-finger nucleic acid-binding protein
MKCPRDQTELTIKSKEGVVGYCCNDCNGVFLNGSGMKAFKINFQTEVLEYTFMNTLNQQSKLFCSHCENLMHRTHIGEIEIDICQHCKGVWFDKDEVYKTIENYSPNAEKEKTSWFDSITEIITFF